MDSDTDPASQQLDDSLNQHILQELLPPPEDPNDLEESGNHDLLLDPSLQILNSENHGMLDAINSDCVST